MTDQPGGRKFWLVWSPTGRSPVVRHTTEESATQEATRLARAHPGGAFYVLEPVCWAMKTDVIIKDMRTQQLSQEMPF